MYYSNAMKISSLLILFISVYMLSFSQIEKPHFFVECNQALGDTSVKYAKAYARLMADELKDAFPCSKVNTQSDITNKLDSLRFRTLIGDFEGELPSFCDMLAHDYWVHLKLTDYTEGRIMVVARCFKYRKVDCIADAGNIRCGNSFEELTEACRSMTKRLIDMLSKYEICPFTGPINLTIDAEVDTTSKQGYNVYCNETDGAYRREETVYKKTHSEWQLHRKGIPHAEGTMVFNMNEHSTLTIENSCYTCPSGRQGGRIYTRENSFRTEGSGISNESYYKNKKQDDTRIEIEFFDNGTYLITAKATSKPAIGDKKELEKAEGTCDNIPAKPMTLPQEITLPLRVVLGPFPGKSTDDILQQSDTVTRRNPGTNEMETIKYDFVLEKSKK